jgi:hypothetical protein
MNTIAFSPWLEWEEARTLIAAAVAREGFPSLTAYAGNFPRVDLLDLACWLAIARVHSGQLQLLLWEEATETGHLARCARDLLVRALYAKHRAWKKSGGARAGHLEDAFYAWREQLPQNYQHIEDEIRSAMLAVEPPADWVPEHADDSILVSLFDQHWPAEQAGRRYRMRCNHAGRITIEHERELDGEALVSGSPRPHAAGSRS